MQRRSGGGVRRREMEEMERRKKREGMWRVEAESSAAGSGGETTAGPELLPRPARPTEGGGGGAPVTGGVDVSATALGDAKRYECFCNHMLRVRMRGRGESVCE